MYALNVRVMCSEVFICVPWLVWIGGGLAKAFVLINAEIGAERDVLNTVSKIPEVKDAYIVYGVYDIITVVEATTMQELKDVIGWKIRRMDKVRSTVTMVVI